MPKVHHRSIQISKCSVSGSYSELPCRFMRWIRRRVSRHSWVLHRRAGLEHTHGQSWLVKCMACAMGSRSVLYNCRTSSVYDVPHTMSMCCKQQHPMSVTCHLIRIPRLTYPIPNRRATRPIPSLSGRPHCPHSQNNKCKGVSSTLGQAGRVQKGSGNRATWRDFQGFSPTRKLSNTSLWVYVMVYWGLCKYTCSTLYKYQRLYVRSNTYCDPLEMDDCLICWETAERITTCNHAYCNACFGKWSQMSGDCAACRRPFEPEDQPACTKETKQQIRMWAARLRNMVWLFQLNWKNVFSFTWSQWANEMATFVVLYYSIFTLMYISYSAWRILRYKNGIRAWSIMIGYCAWCIAYQGWEAAPGACFNAVLFRTLIYMATGK